MMDSAALTPKRSSKWITRCGGCDETVTREDALKGQVVSAAGRLYHRSHFHCSSCKANLPNLEYYPSGNSVTCLDCYLEENNPRCEECNRPVYEEYLTIDEKCYHHDCFVCQKCKNPIPNGEYLILDGKFYDEDCYYTTKYNLTKLL
ncbi:hypothetical protein V3C99_003718 [Haemonchus contortus]|uniref:LIM zinc-binding domain-containing protein n=1 Tax=Haemonchus contortus TaxID=6289 RepID=A0A7I4Y0A3_HAECO